MPKFSIDELNELAAAAFRAHGAADNAARITAKYLVEADALRALAGDFVVADGFGAKVALGQRIQRRRHFAKGAVIAQGGGAVGSSPKAFGEFLKNESSRWLALAKEVNISAD